MPLKRMPLPVKIELPDEGREIEISWSDGEVTRLAAFHLRAKCPCAGCVDEMTGMRTLDPASVPADIRAASFQRVGRYALQFQWSDGHATGIYAYDRLREGFPEA